MEKQVVFSNDDKTRLWRTTQSSSAFENDDSVVQKTMNKRLSHLQRFKMTTQSFRTTMKDDSVVFGALKRRLGCPKRL